MNKKEYVEDVSDCERQIRAYVEELEEDPQSVIDNALEILTIQSLTTWDDDPRPVGYIIVLATGGPHIEINTRDSEIGCWWGGEEKVYFLSSSLVREMEEYIDEMYLRGR